MNITGSARVAGVVGWPITHSLSPLLQGYWLAEKKLNGVLVPLGVEPEDFALAIDGLRRAGFRGVNVTVPHKEAAFALAHVTDAAARAAGAANLLVFHDDGRIEARNTDAFGLAQALRDGLGEGALRGQTAVLLGAGGGARGAVIALAELGVGTIQILNRHADRARSVAAHLAPMVKSKLMAGGMDGWTAAAGQAALLVNATSAGMNGVNPLELDLDALPAGAAVFDMVYKPLDTDLLRRARARGLKTLDGLGMLMHQAAPSFEAFFGMAPEVSPGLRAHLVAAL
jgi:shikimate dehydrogenase